MRRERLSTGGVRKQRGRWIGMWYADGKRRSQVVGSVKDTTKGEAREEVAKIIAAERAQRDTTKFKAFVDGVYLPFYRRKWKHSTCGANENRIAVHLIPQFGDRELESFSRDEFQDFLDSKGSKFSFSVVAHLRWDLRQIFQMAVGEGRVQRNPALLLFVPKTASKPKRRVMTILEVQKLFEALGPRERLIAKLAVLAGMRPGEILALTWGQISDCADIRQRVYRGIIDTPKTVQSERKAALSEGLLRDLEEWRKQAVDTSANAWVFPSENMTPLAKENVWRRSIVPKLEKAGLEWANFQVMRRTHSTLMSAVGVEGKLVADQMGHTLDVNQNVYTQSPVALRQEGVNRLESALSG
jgi:integrase